jgi:hypothetical protein
MTSFDIREQYEARKRRYDLASATNSPALPRLKADLIRSYDALVAAQD